MPGCSTQKKTDCMARTDCAWVPGKGCKSAARAASPPAAKPASPRASPRASPKAFEPFKAAEIGKVRDDVKPGMKLAKEVGAYVNAKVGDLLARSLIKMNMDTVTPTQVHHLHMLGQWSQLATMGDEQAAEVMRKERDGRIKLGPFHKRVNAAKLKNAAGKALTFTPEGAAYLAGLVEYLLAELLEIGGAEAKAANKATITPAAIEAAIAKDDDIRKVFAPTRDWAVHVFNGKQVL